jgi:hypothetical protein
MEESDYEKVNCIFDSFVNSFETGIIGLKIDHSNPSYEKVINEFIQNYHFSDELALAEKCPLKSLSKYKKGTSLFISTDKR